MTVSKTGISLRARRRFAVRRFAGTRLAGRRVASAVAVSALVALLAACGASTGPGTAESKPSPSTAGSQPSAGASPSESTAGESTADASGAEESSAPASAYPMTLKTAHGDVTIEAAPTRVLALSVPSADELISLGIEPVAVAVDPSMLAVAYPWMEGALKDTANAELSSSGGELNLEAIAQVRPDLIIAATWQVTDDSVYRQLSSIAPTITPDSTAINVDWDQRLLATAAAVDRTAKAEELITQIRADYAAVGATVPGIATKTYQFVRADADGFGFGNGSVLELYGIKPAANQDNTQNGPTLSKENTAQLDADLLGIWIPTPELEAGLAKDPMFQSLPAVKGGTIFYADFAVASAANTPGPMALAWLNDRLTPTIEKLG